MIGILTHPGAASAGQRAVLCWNTGVAHRIGANRLNVELSYVMAGLGLPTFRFDLRGCGDSEAGTAELKSAMGDVVEAMDYMQSVYGVEEFVLVGLCSGAIEAHYVAAADARVVGLCMIDTYSHRVGAYKRHYFQSRLFNKLFLGRLWRKGFRKANPLDIGAADDRFFVAFPSLETIRQDFRSFLSRGVRCLAIYTQGYEHVFNHVGQFQTMLADVDADSILTVEHHDTADHLYTDIHEREKLLDSICRWVSTL